MYSSRDHKCINSRIICVRRLYFLLTYIVNLLDIAIYILTRRKRMAASDNNFNNDDDNNNNNFGNLLSLKVILGGVLSIGFLVVGILCIVYSCFVPAIDQSPRKDLDPPRGLVIRKHFFVSLGKMLLYLLYEALSMHTYFRYCMLRESCIPPARLTVADCFS